MRPVTMADHSASEVDRVLAGEVFPEKREKDAIPNEEGCVGENKCEQGLKEGGGDVENGGTDEENAGDDKKEKEVGEGDVKGEEEEEEAAGGGGVSESRVKGTVEEEEEEASGGGRGGGLAEKGKGNGGAVGQVGGKVEDDSAVFLPVVGADDRKHGGPNVPRKKVDILLKAVGDAPIMKQKKWSVDPHKTVQGIIQFVRKYIKCEAEDALFLYVNQSFAPSPDQVIGSLYECFGSDGKLVLHYCKSLAWG
uniref:Ubiquitin-like protein ATG12 n=1 Tax=Eptatretus burgeri TaxID=7764 RepID=A0A8C4R8L8_EPTBU